MIMSSHEELLKRINEYRELSVLGGGKDKIEQQKQKGKLWVRERIEKLLDPGSFVEFQWMRTHRSTYFGLDKQKFYSDGVVVGYGKLDGKVVYVYAQDFTVLGGSIGEAHGEKIARLIEQATQIGVPVIGLYDSGGARIQEGVAALHGCGKIFYANVKASGVVPQIALILGPCAGAAAYSPALMDFVIMVKGSYMFITGPEVVKAATGVSVTFEQLGGAEIHGSISGCAHFVAETEEEAFAITRKLLSYLPSNSTEDPPYVPTDDPVDRRLEELYEIVPTDPMKPFDVRHVIRLVVDNEDFLEVHANYAKSAVVGFGRIGGHSLCIVANQPAVNAGVIDIESSNKIARFVRFCDSFNLPIVTFVDTPGFMPGVDQEHGGIIKHGAKVLHAYAEATVPKITVVMRKAYGGAYIAMGSLSLGSDINYAWPTAEIAVMGPEGAVRILHRREIDKAADPEAMFREKLREYRELFANPFRAAELGYIDDVIDIASTRKKIYEALVALSGKRTEIPPLRKHTNMPL
ncbi:MAG: acyl-CoA carboxylase subunit beta [Desulfurococcaceae archaeon]